MSAEAHQEVGQPEAQARGSAASRAVRWLAEPMHARSVAVALGLGAVLVGASLDLEVALRGAGGSVKVDAVKGAADVIRGMLAPGDLVVHSPLLGMEALAGLGEIASRPDLPPASVRRSRRILVLDRQGRAMHGFGAPAKVRPLPGGLVLRVFTPATADALTLFDLSDQLPEVRVSVRRLDGTTRSVCAAPRSPSGRSCPGEPEWLYVAPTVHRVAGEDVPCVWAHPREGALLTFELPPQTAPPLGRALRLRLEAALTDEAVRQTPDGGTVISAVFQSGAELGQVRVENRIGWFHGEFAIEAAVPVELRVSASRDGRRHHCINAQVFEVESP